MKLHTLLQSLDIVQQFNAEDISVTGIAYHSKKVVEGNVFVCIRGYKVDGHQFLAHAVENGAKAAIVEEMNESISIPQYVVKNSRNALAKLSAAYYDEPSKKLQMIGITATNGKTTSSYMTNAILEKHHLITGLIGTIKVKIGDEFYPSDLTTPESLDLQYYLNEMVEKDVTHVMMEVSSAAQEMHRVDAVDYDIVTLNNINREHIDTHGTFENYVHTKTKLIKEAKQDSIALLNLDCAYTEQLMSETEATPITFSITDRKGHVCCKNLDLSTGRAKFTVEILKPIYWKNELIILPSEFDIQLAIPGLHSVSNSMIAIIISLLNGVPVGVIQDVLKQFEGVDRRFEFIYENGPVIIDDHFANPGNIDVTLETLSLMDYEDLHVIYAIRGQRGETVNRENAETVIKWAKKLQLDKIVVTESVAHVTERDEVTAGERDSFIQVMNEANIDVVLFKDLEEAIQYSVKQTKVKDLLLLAGCQGMDMGGEIAISAIQSAKMNI